MADEPDRADAVALLRAHLAGDEEVIDALLGSVDVAALLAVTTGLLVALLAQAGVGAAELDATLADWQERRREDLLH